MQHSCEKCLALPLEAKKGGKPKNMCEALDRIEAKGRLEGEKKGRLEGEKKLADLITKLIAGFVKPCV